MNPQCGYSVKLISKNLPCAGSVGIVGAALADILLRKSSCKNSSHSPIFYQFLTIKVHFYFLVIITIDVLETHHVDN